MEILTAFAAEGIQIANPLSGVCDDAAGCLQSILRGLTILAIPVTAIMVLIGGFQILTANGEEEKIRKGKQTILYAAAGFGIIILSSGIVAVIQDFLSGAGN